MVELFEAVASWPTLLLVLLVFGFAPGFVLRLLVLAYPRSDPRRRDLISELYAVPRIQRPLWVAEQLEVALFEGLAHRIRAIRSITRRRQARTKADKRGVWVRKVISALVGVVGGIVNPIVNGIMLVVLAVVLTLAGTIGGAMTWGTVAMGVVGVVTEVLMLPTRRQLSARARRHSRPC